MASSSKTANGWRAQITLKGVRDSGCFATKAQAQAWASERDTEIRAQQVTGVIAGKTFLISYLPQRTAILLKFVGRNSAAYYAVWLIRVALCLRCKRLMIKNRFHWHPGSSVIGHWLPF